MHDDEIRAYLVKRLDLAEIPFTHRQVEQLLGYLRQLQEWNKVMNLTSIDDDLGIVDRHFIDSLSLIKAVEIKSKCKIMDIGTGAGFPGLPIAIMCECKTSLLDALNKRIKFLDAVIQQNEIPNIELIHGRAEDFAHSAKYRGTYDYVVARAVASLNVLLEYAIPFLKVGGVLVAHKSKLLADELKNSETALKLLNASVVKVVSVELFDDVERNIVIIKKIGDTAKKYPRKAGTPLKSPL